MPSHAHSAAVSTNGNHTHGVPNGNNSSGEGYTFDTGDSGVHYYVNTTSAGAHSHTVIIGSTGGNGSHENRQPYSVVNVWRRTA